ncbi:short-chain dehydrogenase [Meredithblackwellia eburnea MCA 4105]
MTFNAHTTSEEAASKLAASIAGKTVIITGVSMGGLGAEHARVAAKHGALVVLASRNPERLQETEDWILKETPSAELRKLVLDLSSFDSVRKAATEVNAYKEPVDVLVNCAARSGHAYRKTQDGLESQFQVNHLSHFLFTNLIRPRLMASKSPRVVNVSSGAFRVTDILYDDPLFSDGATYEKFKAYGQSKTANLLFSVSIHNRWGIESFSLHPGVIKTNLGRDLTLQDYIMLGAKDEQGNDIPGVYKTYQEGVATQVIAAFDPTIAAKSGSLLWDCKVDNEKATPYALDKENAEKLWKLSEKLVGQEFP